MREDVIMFCRNCAAPLPDDARFCPKCAYPTSYNLPESPNTKKHEGTDNANQVSAPKTNTVSATAPRPTAKGFVPVTAPTITNKTPSYNAFASSCSTVLEKLTSNWRFLMFGVFGIWGISLILMCVNWFKINIPPHYTEKFSLSELGSNSMPEYLNEIENLKVVNTFFILLLFVLAITLGVIIKYFIDGDENIKYPAYGFSGLLFIFTLVVSIAVPNIINDSYQRYTHYFNISVTAAPIFIIILSVGAAALIWYAMKKLDEEDIRLYLEQKEAEKREGTRICPRCGTGNSQFAVLCRNCSARLADTHASRSTIQIGKSRTVSNGAGVSSVPPRAYFIVSAVIWVVCVFFMAQPWVKIKGLRSLGELSIFSFGGLASIAGEFEDGIKIVGNVYNVFLIIYLILVLIFFILFIKQIISPTGDIAFFGCFISGVTIGFTVIIAGGALLIVNAASRSGFDALTMTAYPFLVMGLNILTIVLCRLGDNRLISNGQTVQVENKNIIPTICPHCGANNKGNPSANCYSCGESLYKK